MDDETKIITGVTAAVTAFLTAVAAVVRKVMMLNSEIAEKRAEHEQLWAKLQSMGETQGEIRIFAARIDERVESIQKDVGRMFDRHESLESRVSALEHSAN